jgi:hypothetical protein
MTTKVSVNIIEQPTVCGKEMCHRHGNPTMMLTMKRTDGFSNALK